MDENLAVFDIRFPFSYQNFGSLSSTWLDIPKYFLNLFSG